MNLGLFNELLEALERVGQHIMAAARLPKKRRAELLQVLSDTYEMLDRVLLMVIGRIGRVLDRAERGPGKSSQSSCPSLPGIPSGSTPRARCRSHPVCGGCTRS